MNISPWDCPHVKQKIACDLTNRSLSTVYALVRVGEMELIKVGRSSFITTSSIKAFLHRVETGKFTTKNLHEAARAARRLPEAARNPVTDAALRARWEQERAKKAAGGAA